MGLAYTYYSNKEASHSSHKKRFEKFYRNNDALNKHILDMLVMVALQANEKSLCFRKMSS